MRKVRRYAHFNGLTGVAAMQESRMANVMRRRDILIGEMECRANVPAKARRIASRRRQLENLPCATPPRNESQ